ncbi:hypothetical protein ACOBR2_00415 [Telmatobacter bradus]|uniref:hypothetical protein n=1 Tax=Telmatobacter bradus TaxID=474953 RepID=UPI003B439909
MVAFTQIELDELIHCPKRVVEAPRREMKQEGAYQRNAAKLVAMNEVEGGFSVFLRKNEDFSENFSIGLIYSPGDGRDAITLLRCNGKHGDYNKSFDPEHPHCDFHIHRATERAIEAGYAPEKFADKTTEFASFEEALQVFVKMINLSSDDARKYFPANTQFSLEF